MTVWPGRKVGARMRSTSASKTARSSAPAIWKLGPTPSGVRVASNVSASQRRRGIRPTTRSPRGARPWVGGRSVDVLVSSRTISVAGSTSATSARQAARASASRARAIRRFFCASVPARAASGSSSRARGGGRRRSPTSRRAGGAWRRAARPPERHGRRVGPASPAMAVRSAATNARRRCGGAAGANGNW